MTREHPRELRIAAHQFDFALACWREQPGRSLWLTVDEHRVDGVRTEYLTRAVAPETQGPASPAPRSTFVLRWESEPQLAMARALVPLLRAGHAGCAFLAAEGSSFPPRGHVRAGTGGVNWLDFLHVAGPGLASTDMTIAGDAARAVVPSGSALLGQRRIAVVGAELAAHVATELAQGGARQLGLLDDGGRIDLRALGLLTGFGPEDIGAFRADALAQHLRAAWGIDAESHVADRPDIDARLTRMNPDVVIGCETDRSRRAAVAQWCAEHQRMLVEVAPDDPWLWQQGRAGATLRAVVPGAARQAGPSAAFTPELFEDLPLPDASAWLGDLGQHGVALRLALYQRAGRAAAAALVDLARGETPADLRIRVTQRADGRIVGSTCEMHAPDAKADPDTGASAMLAGLTT